MCTVDTDSLDAQLSKAQHEAVAVSGLARRCYKEQYRPMLVWPDSPSSALWLSSRHGGRITDKYVATLIGATTLSTVGVKVSPHLFRTSAASAAAIYGGENPHLGSAILHNADPRVTLEHYNRATSWSAAESFRHVIRQYEKPDAD